ncbi:alpha/beta fold hydrolase [Hymenobacter sp. UYP22]|uniref:alpha/beta fold hydrolase n=1 Tax=Hymenobacter sp. UYP22 TaxID=3156348 RepID=UPI0033947ABB
MRLFWFMLLICCLRGEVLSAQVLRLEGTVLDRTTHAPVPFATLGIVHQPLGSVANERGMFKFSLPAAAAAAQVLVSCVGYAPVQLSVEEFRRGAQTIYLPPVAVPLGEVTVRARPPQTTTFGRTGSATFMGANLYTEPSLVSDELGREQGTVVSVDPKCQVRSVSFFVAFNRFKSVIFRLQFYRVDRGLPGAALPHKDVVFTVTQPRGWVKIDLRPYQVSLQGERKVAVTLQWLRSESLPGQTKAFGLAAVPTPGHTILFREKSQAQWQAVKPGHLSLYLTADSYGPARRTDLPTQQAALSDSLRYGPLLGGLARPASSRHYGDSAAVGRSVAVTGGRLYYEEYGWGEPLLLLHGNSQSIEAFAAQIGELSRHFRVIAVDTRAQGRSQDATTTPLSYELFAADMRQLLDSLQLRQVNVLGWSDGGNTALTMALRYPSYVRRLAVMGANLFPGTEALNPDFWRVLQQRAAHPEAASPTQTRLLQLLLREPQLTFENLTRIQAPTLVMAGEHDLILPLHTRSIAAHLPQATLVIFPGATHFAPQEIPQAFNEQVTRFFRTANAP